MRKRPHKVYVKPHRKRLLASYASQDAALKGLDEWAKLFPRSHYQLSYENKGVENANDHTDS